MERRFVVFLVLTLLMWTGFIVLRAYLAPEPPPLAQQKDKVEQKKQGEPAAQPNAADRRPDGAATKPPDAEANPPTAEVAAAPGLPTVARQRLTLGSADPNSGYSALCYFDNHGAALECAELNGDRYKSIEEHSGYLGRLGLSPAATGGVLVSVVGPGTPAALAQAAGNPPGLAVGDVIQGIDGAPVSDVATFENYLRERTRPGQEIRLTVIRAAAAPPLEFKTKLVRHPLAVIQPESHVYSTPEGNRRLPQDPLSLLVTLDRVGSRKLSDSQEEFADLPSLHKSNWALEQQGNDFIEFSVTLDKAMLAAARMPAVGPLKIVKRYSLAKPEKPGELAFHLNLQVAIHNLGDEPLPVAYRLGGPTGLPLEGWWYSTKLHPQWSAAGARDVVWNQPGVGHQLLGCPKIVSDAKAAAKKDESPLNPLLTGDQASAIEYAGVDTQFFASAIRPQEIEKNQPIRFSNAFALPVQDVTVIPKTRLKTANVSVRLVTSETLVEPGSALKHDYQVFIGPKDPAVLSVYRLEPLIEYGWPIFKYPAIWLRGILNGLYWLTGVVRIPNYGIAIILLTVIVRSCMIPVSLKQARSAAKMQELAPEVQKIKDKFPDDPMKQHQAVQELYKKHDFNMFGGCLPVFIQLPIFIGLYRCLSVDIDLRDASLFPGLAWASNLAGPDKLFQWSSWMPAFFADEGDGWLGPFFNVFPLITVALFLVQQKMFTPPATDEQSKMQQQMMTYMTVFMGVMFYKVPAGLCIYFITSSLWGICERKLLPKSKPNDNSATGGTGTVARLAPKPASPNGSAKTPARQRPKQRR